MFSPSERDLMHRKALEQAKQASDLAHSEVEVFLPVERRKKARVWPTTWTHPSDIIGDHCFAYACGLTGYDEAFLKINKISPA